MRERLLIIGGFGFVGSKLVELLQDRYEITIFDNLLSGLPLNIGGTFIYGDIRDFRMVQSVVPEFDTIVHLAAVVGEPACIIHPQFAYTTNVEGTRNILASMRKNQHLIFTSTSSVYGNRPNERVTEESLPKPVNNYARHKYQSELDIITARIPYTIVRPVTAFGITQRTRLDLLVNTLIYNALSFGRIEVYEPHIMRPIIHVIDFARVLIAAIDKKLKMQHIYNIGDPAYTMTKLQLAREVAMLCGATVIEKPGSSLDPRDYDVSFDKLIDTGFTFGDNRLALAVEQIKAALDTIAKNPESFSTPEKVRLFLERDSKGVL